MFVVPALTILATALVVRLVVKLARRSHGRRCGGGGGGFGRSRWLRWLFRSLDTTPGQEKVIRGALEEAWTTAREARVAARGQRANVAAALRAEGAEAAAFAEAQAGARAAYDRAEQAVVAAFRSIHEVLDPMQRERLAQIVDGSASPWRGRLAFGGGGPYRGQASL